MKVLIVDDEPIIIRTLQRVFKARSYEVKTALNGNDGLEIWKTWQPDLVVLDVLMPGRTGPEMVAEMGSNNKAVVVLMSAYSGKYRLEVGQSEGIHLFIAKPFDNIFEVVDKIEVAVDEQRKHHQKES